MFPLSRVSCVRYLAFLTLLISVIFYQTIDALARLSQWDENLNYLVGNVVEYDGETYRATAPTKGHVPPVYLQYWERLDTGRNNQAGSTDPNTDVSIISDFRFDSLEDIIETEDDAAQGLPSNAPLTSNFEPTNIPLQTQTASSDIGDEADDISDENASEDNATSENGVINEWDNVTTYLVGNKVFYKDGLWTAVSTSTGSPPSQGYSWHPDGVYIWYDNVRYRKYDIVYSQGQYWQAVIQNSGLKPSRASEDWVPLGIIQARYDDQEVFFLARWTPDTTYNQKGLPVYHDGRIWLSQDFSKGATPGDSSLWIPYGPKKGETGASLLLFQSEDEAINDEDNSIADNNTVPDPVDTQEVAVASNAWNTLNAYEAGSRVLYEGHEWKNVYWSQGQEPGEDPIWQREFSGAGPHPWLNTQIYATPNQQVTHNGATYSNKWWSQNHEPGSNLPGSEVWMLISASTDTDDGDTGSGDGDTGSGDGDTGSGDGDTGSGDGDTGSGDGDTGSGDGDTGSGDGDTGSGDGDTDSDGGDTDTGDGDTGSGDGDTGSGDGDTDSGSSGSCEGLTATAEMSLAQAKSQGAKPWHSSQVYIGGDLVTHQSLAGVPSAETVWRARYWTMNNTPGSNDGVWQLVYTEPVIYAWFSFQIYNKGDVVSHNGDCYEAQHYTQNNTPGEAGTTHWKLK